MAEVTDAEIDAGQQALRAALEETGYSSFVSDEQCRALTVKMLEAAAAVRTPDDVSEKPANADGA